MKSKNPVGRFDFEEELLVSISDPIEYTPIINGGVIKNLISVEEKEKLIGLYKKQEKIPVGIDGIVSHYNENEVVQSYRATLFSKTLAFQIYERIKGFIPNFKGFEPIGINESFRFIDYQDSGALIPHYDGSYIRNNKEKSLLSLVIYLKSGETGKTQFVKENRDNHNYQDWDRMANDFEIIETVKSEECSALMFEHEILHQSEKVTGNKIIIRTDVMFRKVR